MWLVPVKDTDLVSELLGFGITKQEADLFLVMVRVGNSGHGGVSGNELADLAGVNRIRTYQLLDRLVDLGLAQVELGRPKRYVAEDPQTAIRRLVARQESKLNQLSLKEKSVADALMAATPLRVLKEGPRKAGGSTVAVLHGISTIQGVLRRAMEGKDVRAVVNDESEDHIFSTIRYSPKKPKSVRVVFGSVDANREPFEGERVVIDGYGYRVRVFKGSLPTVLTAGDQGFMLFYESQRYRPKPLSAVTVRTIVSSCIVVEGAEQVGQLNNSFEALWKGSR